MACEMKFGVWLPVYGGWLIGAPIEEPEISYTYVEKCARKAEELTFDSVWIADHLLNPRKGEQVAALEAWSTLTAVATHTKRVKLGHAVLCQGFRYPAVLAKMAATLDEISNGRFIFALGAGWFKREFEAYGIPWGDHDELIERAGEQIKIVNALWTQESVNFSGRYYRLVNANLVPKPVQKPRPLIWYGGNSEKSRQLVADNSGIDGWFISSGSLDEVREKISDMKSRTHGRKLEYAMYAFTLLSRTEQEGEDMVKRLATGNPSTITWALKPGLVGPPAKIIERLHKFQQAGINHVTLLFSSTLDSLAEFSRHVIERMY